MSKRMRNAYKKRFKLVKLGFIQLLIDSGHEWILDHSIDPRYGLADPEKASHGWFVIYAKKLAFLGEKSTKYMLEVSNSRLYDIVHTIPYKDAKKVVFKSK